MRGPTSCVAPDTRLIEWMTGGKGVMAMGLHMSSGPVGSNGLSLWLGCPPGPADNHRINSYQK